MYPRILFINIDFSEDNSAGITVSKIINDFPKQNLALATQNPSFYNPNFLENKFIFTPKGQVKRNSVEKNKKTTNKYQIFFRWFFRNIIGSPSYFEVIKIDSHFKNWLLEFNPDFIYITPDSLKITKLGLNISRFYKGKIIIHVLDDKVNVLYPGILGIFYKLKFKKCFKCLIKISSIRLSISNKMSEVYYARYGVNFTPIHNAIDLSIWHKFTKSNARIEYSRPIQIVYTGDIQANWKSLVTYCYALELLNLKGYNIVFHIYTNFKRINFNVIKDSDLNQRTIWLSETRQLINNYFPKQ